MSGAVVNNVRIPLLAGLGLGGPISLPLYQKVAGGEVGGADSPSGLSTRCLRDAAEFNAETTDDVGPDSIALPVPGEGVFVQANEEAEVNSGRGWRGWLLLVAGREFLLILSVYLGSRERRTRGRSGGEATGGDGSVGWLGEGRLRGCAVQCAAPELQEEKAWAKRKAGPEVNCLALSSNAAQKALKHRNLCVVNLGRF